MSSEKFFCFNHFSEKIESACISLPSKWAEHQGPFSCISGWAPQASRSQSFSGVSTTQGLTLMGPGLLGVLNSPLCVLYFGGWFFYCQLSLFIIVSASNRSLLPNETHAFSLTAFIVRMRQGHVKALGLGTLEPFQPEPLSCCWVSP